METITYVTSPVRYLMLINVPTQTITLNPNPQSEKHSFPSTLHGIPLVRSPIFQMDLSRAVDTSEIDGIKSKWREVLHEICCR
jgi:hypothetical protein